MHFYKIYIEDFLFIFLLKIVVFFVENKIYIKNAEIRDKIAASVQHIFKMHKNLHQIQTLRLFVCWFFF